MRLLIAVLLSALLIGLTKQTPVKNLGSAAAVTTPAGQVHQRVTAPAKAVTKAETLKTQTAKTQPETVLASQPVPQVQGCAAYVPLLQQYDWNYQVMAAVMQAESSCNPNAVNPVNYDGVPDYGLMQLHGQEIYDPATNIAHAYALWKVQGYHAWSSYNSGAFYQYL